MPFSKLIAAGVKKFLPKPKPKPMAKKKDAYFSGKSRGKENTITRRRIKEKLKDNKDVSYFDARLVKQAKEQIAKEGEGKAKISTKFDRIIKGAKNPQALTPKQADKRNKKAGIRRLTTIGVVGAAGIKAKQLREKRKKNIARQK